MKHAESKVEKTKSMASANGKKYFNIVYHESNVEREEVTDCVVIFNGSKESLAESSPCDKEEVREIIEDYSKAQPAREKEIPGDNCRSSDLSMLGLGATFGNSVNLSISKSGCTVPPQNTERIEMCSQVKEVALVISELKSRNASPVYEDGIKGTMCQLNFGNKDEPRQEEKSNEIKSQVPKELSLPPLPRNNNSQKRSSKEGYKGPRSRDTPMPKMKKPVNKVKPMQNTDSYSYDDSDESIVSISKIHTDKASQSSDIGPSSLYFSEETPEVLSPSDGQTLDNSTYTFVTESKETTSTEEDKRKRPIQREKVRKPKPKHLPDILTIDNKRQPGIGKNRVPVVLKAEARYLNGELMVTVKDERNSCPEDADVKITVVHGASKKKINSKFAAYNVVPRFPRTLNWDRDIVKHRAMRPPFNTHVDPEAADRHRRHYGLE